ncbi:hypothetical protein C469_00921 [Halorubrum lipolyticum DSM 21995]|uniref:Uncharacterized protein n=1 Tax=Halorubrum lipolyticum DSM 21995 TaxID=1227482 RepID=M0P6J0_9EURY|nr:hypothetical protein C469_00921 [Halorubrum lipolyticum DSM 21995]
MIEADLEAPRSIRPLINGPTVPPEGRRRSYIPALGGEEGDEVVDGESDESGDPTLATAPTVPRVKKS